MQRRNVLKALASTALGAGWMALRPPAGHASAPRPQEVTASGSRVSRDGVSLFCKDWGEGRPVVFVHSWASHSDMWQYQMVHLAQQGVRCIAYDRRGHGRSSDPGRGYDFDSLAADLDAVLETLDLRDAVLVGHSMGAGDVVRYLSGPARAARAPRTADIGSRRGRVARVLLAAPSLPFLLKAPDNPDGIERAVFERMRAKLCADFPKWLADNAPPFFVPETSPEMIQWGLRMSHQTSLQAVVETHRALTETDFRAELRQLTLPVLILHGDRDRSAPLDFTGRDGAAHPGLRAADLRRGAARPVPDPHGALQSRPSGLREGVRSSAHPHPEDASGPLRTGRLRALG